MIIICSKTAYPIHVLAENSTHLFGPPPVESSSNLPRTRFPFQLDRIAKIGEGHVAVRYELFYLVLFADISEIAVVLVIRVAELIALNGATDVL
jgi:hypothetical protein